MANKMPHYEIKGKAIEFDIREISPAEMKQLKKFEKMGYVLTPIVKEQEKKVANPLWTETAIQAFLKEKGTKEQEKHYWELYNAPVIDKNTNEAKTYKTTTKKHKAGEVKKQGHIATLRWFKDTFPEYGK